MEQAVLFEEPQAPQRPEITLIESPIELRSQGLLNRLQGHVGPALDSLARRMNSTRVTRSERESALRAHEILARYSQIFRDSIGVESSQEVRLFIRRGALEFDVLPQCGEELRMNQVTGRSEYVPCTHSQRSPDCKRAGLGCRHGCTPRLGVIGCRHFNTLQAKGENHK